MQGDETFPNAPIIEATVDFAARFRSPLKVADLDRYGEVASALFPKRHERHASAKSVTIGGDEPILRNSRRHLVEFCSADDKYISQIRQDGISFTRVRPYTSWNDFSERALSAYEIYVDVFKPLSIPHITLRYFNSIDLPNPARVKDYFKTRILLPASLPQNVMDAFFAFSFLPKNNMIGNISFFIDRHTSDQHIIRVVFVIVVISHKINPIHNKTKIRQNLANLRNFKNRVFFRSITEKLKEQFR
jgi:uncharacterized protein (TIGR04255 family)